MFVRGVFPGIFLFVFSFLFVHCYVEDDKIIYVQAEYWKNQQSLRCYDCNSDFDPRCNDPFDGSTIGIVNCSELKPPEHLLNLKPHDTTYNRIKPTVCRKIVQKIEGKTRVIRECGYIQDKHDDKGCSRRSGTKDVQVHYCACTKSLCNTASPVHSFRPSLVVEFLVLGAVALMFCLEH